MSPSNLLIGLGRPVAYYAGLAKIIGVKECVFVCQLLYWCDKTQDGWIYKTQENIEDETGLSRTEQENARKNLKNKGVLEERHRRIQHRMFYKLDIDKLVALWESHTNAGNPHSVMQETPSCEPLIPAPANAQLPLSSLETQSTSETTTVPILSGPESIYAIYPRKQGKQEALKSIIKALKQHGMEKIKEATSAYAQATSLWSENDRQYIPHPATWFNQGRFEDDRETWKRKTNGHNTTDQRPNVRSYRQTANYATHESMRPIPRVAADA